MKAILIPFGYPGYPEEYLNRFTQESRDTITGLGIELKVTPIVIVRSDIAEAQEALRSEDYDFIIPLILTWLEVPNVIEAIQEMFHKPILLWSHTMFRENGELLTLGPIPAAGVLREAFEELGVRFRFIYGMPWEEKIKTEIKDFAVIASTIHKLKHSRIGLLGYASMGMYTAAFDHLPLRQKLGPEIDHVGQYLIIKRIEEMEDERVKALVKDARAKWEIGSEVSERDLMVTLKMYVALKDLAKEFGWSALTVKCQYELSKYYKAVPCVPLSMLGDEIPCSCEGDIPLITTQLMMHYLTGAVVTYADVHTITEKGILFGACGFAPFSLCSGSPKVDKTTILYEGVANCTIYREGEVTLARLAYRKDRSFKMHIIKGTAQKPEPFHEVCCLSYPSMDITFDGSAEKFAQTMMSQHYALVYGNVYEKLLGLCELLEIEPITIS